MQKAHEQYHDQDVVILSVSIGEKQKVVQDFAEARRLTMRILLDEDGSIARTYRVSGIPVSFFIDREGVIRTRHLGPLNEMLILQYVQLVP
ncbi:MAG: TlpA family protein disulfide reductase [Chloroflexi bacterium]|nr:TlpA family protein disulfide reductase [Chloroflexota bacterium]